LINEEEFMDMRALHLRGLSYAQIGRLVGRDWRTVKRYLGGRPVGLPPQAGAGEARSVQALVDRWLAGAPALQAARIHQDLARNYLDGFLSLVGSMGLVTFWACHCGAFAHFGGAPREILYDRTKTIVRSHVGRERRIGERLFIPRRCVRRTSTASPAPVPGPPRQDQGQGRV
jgi:hypothetical protein